LDYLKVELKDRLMVQQLVEKLDFEMEFQKADLMVLNLDNLKVDNLVALKGKIKVGKKVDN
jgi:hypothetical protein